MSTVQSRKKSKSTPTSKSSSAAAGDGAPPAHGKVSQHSNGSSLKSLRSAGGILFLVVAVILAFLTWRPAKLKTKLSDSFPGSRAPEDLLPDIEKQQAVQDAFKYAWKAYVRDAWGSDEYHPITQKGSNLTYDGGIGYMIVDALDAMLIMGLEDEYRHARDWVSTHLSFDKTSRLNAFEVTIRVLGGLLSAYHLSQDEVFLKKAVDLGDRLMPIFDTETGVPLSFIDLGGRVAYPDLDNNGWTSTAEAATLQLEFKYLAHITENAAYWRAAERVMEVIARTAKGAGLIPIFLTSNTGQFVTSDIRFGSRGDSYYEYLLKQYLQTGKTEPVYREMWDEAIDALHSKLLQKTPTNGMTYVAELSPRANYETRQFTWNLVPKQDHLACFLGGALLLGASEGDMGVPPDPKILSNRQKRDMYTGVQIIRTCMETHETETGLSPEIAHFKQDGDDPNVISVADWYIKGASGEGTPYDARYILRPETVESLFLAYRITGDEIYRKWGWHIFQSIEKYCKLPSGGYASILNVDDENSAHDDKMETFFLSETLKYLYLLFSGGDVLPLSDIVFNTEAHPLPVFVPSIRSNFF